MSLNQINVNNSKILDISTNLGNSENSILKQKTITQFFDENFTSKLGTYCLYKGAPSKENDYFIDSLTRVHTNIIPGPFSVFIKSGFLCYYILKFKKNKIDDNFTYIEWFQPSV